VRLAPTVRYTVWTMCAGPLVCGLRLAARFTTVVFVEAAVGRRHLVAPRVPVAVLATCTSANARHE